MANMFSSFFNPGDAYKKAMNVAEQGWQDTRKYEEPFWQMGQQQIDPLNQARQALLNPVQLEDQWSEAYEPSQYAQRMLAMNRGQGLESASSMGLMGSSAALNNINRGAADIMGQDRREFLNSLMQKFLSGIGLGQNLLNTGANMGAHLGDQRMQHGSNMGALAYGRQAAPGQLLENLINTAINASSGGMFSGMGGNQSSMPPYARNAIMNQGG